MITDSYYTVTINFKPWKGKISHFVFVGNKRTCIETQVYNKIEQMKLSGKYKRRTLLSYTISLNQKL